MDDKEPSAPKEPPSFYLNFTKLFETKPKKVALFTHACPDPDAIGSMMGLEWLLSKKYGIESVGFYSGSLSHPQNVAMVNLLDPVLRPVSEYEPKEYDMRIVVDTVPVNAGLGDHTVNFELVIDHHKEIPNGGFNGTFINLKAGSCCGTIYQLIKQSGLRFEDDNDIDSKVATALMVGISTDTEALMSDDATEYEFLAWSELFEHRSTNILKKIVHFERPKFWIDHKAEAVKNTVISEGLGVVGLGMIPGKHRDIVADMASEMVTWEDVNTAVVFAVVDGDRIEGSVRSRTASIMVPQLCKELASKHGAGGGKLGKGAYRYSLGGAGIDEEDDEITKEKTWELLNEKETKRIIRITKK